MNMFRRFKREQEIQCPIVLLDLHTTSPQPATTIPQQATSARKPSLFEQANRFYEKSRRPVRRRSFGII